VAGWGFWSVSTAAGDAAFGESGIDIGLAPLPVARPMAASSCDPVGTKLNYHRAALVLRPEVGAVHNDLGMILIVKGRPETAIRHFWEAIRLDLTFALAHANLGVALHNNDGQADEAMSHLEQALRFDPESAATHINLGNISRLNDRLDDSLHYYKETLRLDPCRLCGPSRPAPASTGLAAGQSGVEDRVAQTQQRSGLAAHNLAN
jgi:tetratricopeptide (TPR) repeat protein